MEEESQVRVHETSSDQGEHEFQKVVFWVLGYM